LWQSVKHTKRRGSQVIKEGWMIHCTNKDPSVSDSSFLKSNLQTGRKTTNLTLDELAII
jgi:hypothetical protein